MCVCVCESIYQVLPSEVFSPNPIVRFDAHTFSAPVNCCVGETNHDLSKEMSRYRRTSDMPTLSVGNRCWKVLQYIKIMNKV